MGLWIFESCRREWEKIGVRTDYETLLDEVGRTGKFCGLVFPDDERFLNPPSMLRAIEAQLAETGQTPPKNPVYVTKVILDSLAFRYASVLRTIESLTGKKIGGVQIVGGGGRNNYLNQMTADAAGKRVVTGLTEATVTGNCLVQAISAGRFAGLSAAREFVRKNISFKEFAPQRSDELDKAAQTYAALETRFAV